MNEQTTSLQQNKKAPVVLLEQKTSLFLFFYPLLSLFCFIYAFGKSFPNMQFLIVANIIYMMFQYYFLYYGKRIILTNKKIYIYVQNKKINSWSLLNDFAYVNYEQNKIEKFLNIGTLILVNNKKETYCYYFLKNPKQVYEAIATQYENLIVEKDSTYIRQFNIQPKNIDTLD